MKILVADDDPATRKLMNTLITSWGYHVVLAVDGKEAWEAIQSHDPPEIAILDWDMPQKTGVEICSACARDDLPIYRILVTAKDGEEDFIYALDHGAHDFQSKPIAHGILKSRITVGVRFVQWLRELISSERLAETGRLAAGIAHHFNNLNTPILLYASSILASPNLDESIKKKVEKIENASEQAKTLTERLMTFAGNRSTKKTPRILNRLIEEILDLQSFEINKMGIDIVVDLSPLPEVMMYEIDVRHVITNLIKNACHALTGQPEKRITIKTWRDEKQVYFSIADTGCGISSNQLNQIFSVFYTDKGEFAAPGSPMSRIKGAGLGLYTVKSILIKHGGNISVKSVVNKGSTFKIWLPVSTIKNLPQNLT